MSSIDKYKAKRHQILTDIKTELSKGHLTGTVEVLGKKFVLKTLNEEEELWSDSYVLSGTTMSMMSSTRTPKLAVSIVSIDGIPVADLFGFPDDMPEDAQKLILSSDIKHRYWLRDQMMLFLNEDTVRPFIMKLWNEFLALEQRRDKALEEVPKA